MTSSPDPRQPDEMPPALPAMWRLCTLGYQHEPALMLVAFMLALLSALPDALIAVWLKLLGDGVLGHRPRLLLAAAIGLGVSATATWFLRTVSTRVTRRFRDKVTIALESHVARLLASIATIAHHERPDYLDRLSLLRNQIFFLDHMYMSVFSTAGWLLRLGISVALLASIHPALVLLGLFALPTVFTSSWRPGVERAAQESRAQHSRLSRHLFTLATTAPAGKEVRVLGIGNRLGTQRREAWERCYGPMAAVRWSSAWWHTLGWALFGGGYVGAVVFVATRAASSPGDVLLVLATGSRLSSYVAATVGEIGFLRMWMDGARRLAWLEDYAASLSASADRPVPAALRQGIRLDHISFAYPGTSKLVLDDVSLMLPAGAVVAIVGENGAGKTSLVKLLAKMYEPSSGSILVDDTPLARIPADGWRARLAGAFQDFFRFEFRARHSIGFGDVPRMDDDAAVMRSVERAGANDVIEKLKSGLDTQLGPTWPEGVDMSFGQWQKLALARGFMRDRPLLLILDEPTAALDAETEHALFERYAAAAQSTDNSDGRITILVSHRFSTVRMAGLILVLDGAKLVESGSHEELMAKGGQYSQLYGIQAAAYR